MTRIVTVANQKGGVGKTTSVVNLAVALAERGRSVLVVDLDPQGNATTGLGLSTRSERPGVYEAVIDGVALAETIQTAPENSGVAVVPANLDLAGAEIELVSMVAREYRLRRAIEAYLADTPVDYVLIDCPPSLGLLTLNALVAGDEVLIPIQCEYYALEGLGQLIRTIDMVKMHLNKPLRISHIVLTMFDNRTKLSVQVADEVRDYFGALVAATVVPRSVRLSEAPGYGRSGLAYDPGSAGALAYVAVAAEIDRVLIDLSEPDAVVAQGQP